MNISLIFVPYFFPDLREEPPVSYREVAWQIESYFVNHPQVKFLRHLVEQVGTWADAAESFWPERELT